MAFYQFYKEQFINASAGALWDFISDPRNLSKITPPDMGFEIRSPNLPDKIYKGMIIRYRVKPLFGIPANWVTEITHIAEGSYFVDEQRAGPYTMWHHQHIIIPADKGMMMKDIVSYQPPFGFLGAIANALVIERKLQAIFDHRGKVLNQLFPAGRS